MKNHPLNYIINESFDRKFVVDKNGKKFFFPWGEKKQGYYVESKSRVEKIKKFQNISLFICFIAFIITVSIFDNFWVTISSLLFYFGGWQLISNFYASSAVKSLPVAKKGYKEIVLERISSEIQGEDKSNSDSEDQVISVSTNFRQERDFFSSVKLIWHRLSRGQLFALYFLLGLTIGLIWSGFAKAEFWKTPFDYLIAAIVFFLWGMSGYVGFTNMESTQKDTIGFIKWKLPMILIMVLFWALAIWFLYEFISTLLF